MLPLAQNVFNEPLRAWRTLQQFQPPSADAAGAYDTYDEPPPLPEPPAAAAFGLASPGAAAAAASVTAGDAGGVAMTPRTAAAQRL